MDRRDGTLGEVGPQAGCLSKNSKDFFDRSCIEENKILLACVAKQKNKQVQLTIGDHKAYIWIPNTKPTHLIMVGS
jgi:hypothetical protein